MTVVVADTSPLNYLVLIGQIDILQLLYGDVLIPPEVVSELSNSGSPPQVANWIRARPGWLKVCSTLENRVDHTLLHIDPGERAAILLAESQRDVLLLMDDAAGRAEANRRRIPNTGTLGVLRAASLRQLLELPVALTRLATTNFRAPASLIEELLVEDRQRRRPQNP